MTKNEKKSRDLNKGKSPYSHPSKTKNFEEFPGVDIEVQDEVDHVKARRERGRTMD
jgi:hypothetical protein